MSRCFKTNCKNIAPDLGANVCCKCVEYYCDKHITKTNVGSYCSKHRELSGIPEKTLDQENAERMAPILKLIRAKNIEELNKLDTIPARMLIEKLKNDLDDLDFFLGWLRVATEGMMPGAGSYHYTDVKDNRTFDLYKKHDFTACNLFPDLVTPEQWKYLVEIGYVGQDSDDEEN